MVYFDVLMENYLIYKEMFFFNILLIILVHKVWRINGFQILTVCVLNDLYSLLITSTVSLLNNINPSLSSQFDFNVSQRTVGISLLLSSKSIFSKNSSSVSKQLKTFPSSEKSTSSLLLVNVCNYLNFSIKKKNGLCPIKVCLYFALS